MKLLVFSPYYPPHMGGLESHADEFNRHLSQKGVDITVFTPHLPQDTPEFEIIHNGVKIYRFPAFEVIPNYPLPKFWKTSFWKLFFDLYKKPFDITISRTRFFSTSLLALIYAKTKRTKWIHIEHGSDYSVLSNKLYTFIAKVYDQTISRITLLCSDLNMANSDASASFTKMLSFNKKCEVIYRGIEIEKILQAQPSNLLDQHESPRIIFVGRLIDGKGVQDLILALASIKEKAFSCHIIGDGSYKDFLTGLAEKNGLQDKITFWGRRDFKDVMGLLKAADIFVNPSYTEGLPTSVIEAALCKKAIIATNVGGTTEIISDQETALLVEPRDINNLGKKLELLMENEDLRNTLGLAAHLAVKDKFNWGNSAEKYLKIFNGLK